MAHLLLIDDNQGDIRLLSEALADASTQVSVHAVPNGVMAFRFLSRQGEFAGAPVPDLIILDLNMPIIDGLSVLREMHRHPLWSKLQVVVLTSSDRDEDRSACLKLGAADYLVKPAVWKDEQALASRLVRYVRGASATKATT